MEAGLNENQVLAAAHHYHLSIPLVVPPRLILALHALLNFKCYYLGQGTNADAQETLTHTPYVPDLGPLTNEQIAI